MSSSQETTQPPIYACGNCKSENSANTKFCEGCGHHLSEPCNNCGVTVTLAQKFCGSCGCNLEEANQQRLSDYEKNLNEAIRQAKLHKYEHSLAILKNVRELRDYRFRSVTQQAEQAATKIENLRKQTVEGTQKKIKDAKTAFSEGNYAAAAKLLEGVPEAFWDTDTTNIFQTARKKADETQTLQNELRDAINDKNWELTGGLLAQLITNFPHENRYRNLAEKVGEKLVRQAKTSAAKGDYNASLSHLHAIPTCVLTNEAEQLRLWASKAHWFSEQIKHEPFATATLGRLALAYAKSTSKSQTAEADSKEIATLLNANQTKGRCTLPRWKADNQSWLGGEFSFLGLPQTNDLGQNEALKAHAGHFNIAIGLALQGLGSGRIKAQFTPEKKRFLASRRTKTTLCWGLDIGSANIKAVLLEKDGDTLTIKDTFFSALQTPTCRKTADGVTCNTLLLPALMKFAKEKDHQNTSVWAGFPTSETVTHFVSIPSLKEKLTQQLLEKELAQKIPLAREEVEVVQWIGTAEPENAKGRPVTLCVARKKYLRDYLEMLENAGITAAGLQCDSLALLNFVTCEFPELQTVEAGKQELSDDNEEAIAFLDCGASSTTLLVVSKQTHWYWTIERGSEAVNSIIARQAKVSHEIAEELKRNPAALQDPATHYALVEKNYMELRARLEAAIHDVQKRNGQLTIKSTWCMGGGSLTHQWLRIVPARDIPA